MKHPLRVIILCALAVLLAGAALADEGVLTLPADLTTVGDEAFYGVTSANKVVVQEGVTTIGARAFAEGGFTEIRLPSTVTEIGDGAFRNCGSATGPVRYFCIPYGVDVNASAFEGCYADVYIGGQLVPYFRYTVGDEGVTITGLNGYGSIAEAVIPDTIEGKPVVAIGDNVFNGKRDLAHVVIPATVTSIGSYAFSNCSALTAIDLPAGLTSLGNGAFYFCQSLTGIDLPAGITALPQETFWGCRALAEIDLTGITSLGKSVFRECRALTEVTIPASITSLPESAFEEAQGLTQIHLPNTLTEINKFAFYGCRALTQIQIPSGITAIPQGVLQNCSALQSVQLPAGVESIGQNAFRSCAALTNINFPAGLVSIGQEAFRDACVGQSANAIYALPDSVETFGSNAFYNCGAGLLVAPGSAFEIFVKENGYTFAYNADNGFRYQYKRSGDVYSLYLTGYKGAGGNVVIPAGPTVIGENAFYENAAVTGVTIPAGVTLLDRSAFEKCSNLASVTMPDGLATIGDRAFHSCGALTNVRFPADLQRIGTDAFDYACTAGGVHYYELPDNIQTLGWAPFDNNFGAVLCFTRGSATATLFQQNQYIYTYKGETDFRYRWYSNEGTEGHQERLLQYVGTAETVEIPPYVWLIDDNAFRGNGTITSVVIPEGVTRINANAFRDCANLTDVAFPESLSGIWDNAFNGCGSAAQETFCFQLPENISYMAGSVFEDCPAVLVCGLETTTAGTISHRGYSFVRKDREQEMDIRYKYAYFNNNEWLWSLYDYVGEANSVRLPDDCARVGGDKLWTKVNNGLELVCGQMSDTAGGLSRAEVNFTFPGHEGLRYRVIDNVLYIMGYTGTDNEIIIPAAQTYVNAGVDEQIRANAFKNKENVTKVVIPEGVTRINVGAFNNCYNLTDITFPNSLKTMEQQVFLQCGRDAAEVFYFVLPDNMEGLAGRGGGANTFEDCNAVLVCGKTSQTAALLSDTNYVYTCPGEYDFRYRYETYPHNSPDGCQVWLVGYVGESATVNIPAGIFGIRWFNNNTTSTYWRTFYGYGFRDNTTVTKVVIPAGTVVIEDSAFRGALNLVDITFPDSLRSIYNHAFEQCGKNSDTLHYYVLPDNMTEISTNVDAGWGAFTDINMGRIVCSPNCSTALQLSGIDIYNHGGSYRFALKGHETDGLLYRYRQYPAQNEGEYENRLILEKYEGTDIEVTIPSGTGLYGIDNRVFQGRNNLQQVIIPSGVEWFGEEVFDGCAVLHEGDPEDELNVIRLPIGLKRIGNLAFKGLGEAYVSQRFFLLLPASLEEFDLNIFTDCNAVLIAPQGSYVAGMLEAGWYYYYYTLADAMAQTNCRYKVDPDQPTHVHYGRR